MKKFLLFIAIAFIGMDANAQAVAEYNFNNTMNNVLGNAPFASGAGLSFVADRNGNANSALSLTNVGTLASIANLPVGNSARTISLWIKSTLTDAVIIIGGKKTEKTSKALSISSVPIFSYGNSSTNAAFGLGKYITTTSSGGIKPIISTTTDLLLYGYGNDLAWSEPSISANWNHFVVTYTGTIASIYMNGVLQATGPKAWNTASTAFRLGMDTSGTTTFSGAVDDLKIYNRAVSAAEVSNLYTNNSILSTQNFQANTLKATISPNPTSNNFSIETENELKSVEIYSLLGQKLLSLTSKTVNVSGLSKGIYMVRIEDINNAVSTQKLIIE